MKIEWKTESGIQTNRYKVNIPIEFLLTGWLVMLLMGMLYHEVSASITPIGYGTSAMIALAVHLILIFVRD